MEQFGDARVDKHEVLRQKKKQEVAKLLKWNYPGVYDRMISMCQPIHKRYNVAITKVLGKYMEAFVVDTEQTARQCIQYLKEEMLGPETFLPLDYIKIQPLKEWLRNITRPAGVKLLFDVLEFSPEAIERAVLFATNNALVCETPDDAMKVAYEMDENRYDCVSLDGTFYQKSGIISGGCLDLARKAKRWDIKQIPQLKERKKADQDQLDNLIDIQDSRPKNKQSNYPGVVIEYQRSRELTGKQSPLYLQKLDRVFREQKADQDRFEKLTQKRTDAETCHHQKGHEKEETPKDEEEGGPKKKAKTLSNNAKGKGPVAKNKKK